MKREGGGPEGIASWTGPAELDKADLWQVLWVQLNQMFPARTMYT